MRFISLFAGIGGFDLGFERAGMRCVAQVEIDRQARAVLQRHYPDVPKFADVCAVGKDNLPAADVICGGFPCQDLSVAGNRAGFGGERSSLFFEMVRITDELRPSFLCWENVVGLLSSRGGADFWHVLNALDTIGYSGAWTGLDAQWFGLAQRRRRIFGMFARHDIGAGCCAKILSLAHRLHGHFETGGEKRADITTAITKSLGAGGADDNDAQGGLLIASPLTAHHGRNNGTDETFVSSAIAQCNRGHADTMAETLRSNSHGALPMVFEPRFARNGRGAPDTIAPPLKAQNDGTGRGDGAPVVAFQRNVRDEVRLFNGDKQLAGALAAQAGMKQQNYIAYTVNFADSGGSRPDRPNGGLYVREADHTEALTGNGSITHILPSTGVRRLTPTECERLQGFPDGWTDGQNDGARYRQLGNAVAVPVVEWIGRRMMNAS